VNKLSPHDRHLVIVLLSMAHAPLSLAGEMLEDEELRAALRLIDDRAEALRARSSDGHLG
jgi:hypothetical protein